MTIVLSRVSVTLVTKADAGLACLLEICLHLLKKLQKSSEKISVLRFRIFTRMHYCGQLYMC